MSKDVYDEVIELAKDFCNEVGEEYLDTFEKAYSSKEYKETLKVLKQ
ncbi:MAG: hypothetical protein QXI49_06810 [Candidatus Methanomethylicaceae archaeon]